MFVHGYRLTSVVFTGLLATAFACGDNGIAPPPDGGDGDMPDAAGPCAGDSCANGGICSVVDDGAVCACPDGFTGDHCEIDIDECADAPCRNGGVCADGANGFTCTCADGYSGDTCVIDIDDCADAPCLNGGACTDGVDSFTCACLDGFAGLLCETDLDLRLTVPARMINDKPLTLRADVLDPSNGKIVTDGCGGDLGTVVMSRLSDGGDVPLTVTFFDDHVPVPADTIRFYHGVGSVSFTLDDGAAVPAGDYVVTVIAGARTASKLVSIEANPVWRVMPATLSGADLVWGPDENIRIAAHTTDVPTGTTLTILPGTLIMVDTTGAIEDGTRIYVNGTLDAQGTLAKPINFFSERGPAAMIHTVADSLSNADAWRGLNFDGVGDSTMAWVILTGAGNGTVVSHPRPPIINMVGNANLTVEDSTFVDSTGMMFQTPGVGTYIIRRSLVSRVGIGAEFLSSGHTAVIEDSWWTGIGRGPTTPIRFDGDGIHLDGFGSVQTVRGCVIADIGDDGIDHSNSEFTIEDTMIHDVNDKAASMTGGLGTFRNTLIYNAGSGVRGTARVYNSTIAAPSPIAVAQVVQDSIVWPSSVNSCSGDIDYSILGSADDTSCGDGNLSVDPQFTDAGACNFAPADGSPARTAGSTGGLVGFAGFPSFSTTP